MNISFSFLAMSRSFTVRSRQVWLHLSYVRFLLLMLSHWRSPLSTSPSPSNLLPSPIHLPRSLSVLFLCQGHTLVLVYISGKCVPTGTSIQTDTDCNQPAVQKARSLRMFPNRHIVVVSCLLLSLPSQFFILMNYQRPRYKALTKVFPYDNKRPFQI